MSTQEKIKVLLVDDSNIQIENLKSLFLSEEFIVITASNGVEGINKIYQEFPDVIISDILMPEINGYQFCRLVKNDPITSHIPVILLSESVHKQDKFWGIESGASLYLNKSTPQLIKHIKELALKRKPSQEGYAGKIYYTSQRELELENAKSRVNFLLDKLLFESTISNYIRELSEFAHDINELAKNFFERLSNLLEYSIGVLYITFDKSSLIYVDLRNQIYENLLNGVKENVIRYNGKINENEFHFNIFNEENLIREENFSQKVVDEIVIPLSFAKKSLGYLGVYSIKPDILTKDTENILKIVSKEMIIFLRYLLKLEEIEKVKSDFTSMIIHNLRSPLTSIKGFTELLMREGTGKINKKQSEMLERILNNVKKMLNLINDVLDISKIEAGKLELDLKPLSVSDILTDVYKNWIVLCEQKKIKIELEIEENLPLINADKEKIEQVMQNLLSNSIKFTKEGGKIKIVAINYKNPLGRRKSDPQYIQISVEDNGIGISSNDLKDIFEKYKQTKSGKNVKDKGTGLGLAICKSIIEAHKGKIWAESEENKGSKFHFIIPTYKG